MLKMFKVLVLIAAFAAVFSHRAPSVERAYAGVWDPWLCSGPVAYCLSTQPTRCDEVHK